MQLETLFRHAIELGMEADPRGVPALRTLLQKRKQAAKRLSGPDALGVDPQDFWNPYADSRILNGTGKERVQSVAVGIDLETPEALLADRLREKGRTIDALIAHHPEGRALGELDKVMEVQIDILKHMGVPEQKAEHVLSPRRSMLYRRIHSLNLQRTPQSLLALGLPCFCCHNAADHLAAAHVKAHIEEKEHETLEDLRQHLLRIPEYEQAAKRGNPPIIAQGSPDSRPGKITLYGFNGGTSGPKEFIRCISEAGVGTILSMHISEEDRKEAKKCHLQIIQCSHMASDSLGMNLTIDGLLQKHPSLKILPLSGFIRIAR